MDKVRMEVVRWIWPLWLPEAKLALLDGGKGRLKSTVTYSIAARITTGKPMPGEKKGGEPGGVIIFQNEDDEGDTVKPKLIAAGADLRLVWVIPHRRDPASGRPQPISLPEDLSFIEDLIRKFEAEVGVRVRLVTIDPILGYLSEKIHYGNDPQVRKALVPLAGTARQLKVAFLLLRHLNKNVAMDAENRGGGSVAFGNVPRVHMLAEWHPEHPSIGVLAQVNNNLARQPQSLTYQSVEATVTADSVEAETYYVKWGEHVNITADALLARKDARKNAPVRDELQEWLEEVLGSGKMKVPILKKEAQKAGHGSWVYIDKVAKRIGVVRKAVYKGGKIDHWTWELPKQSPEVSFDVSNPARL
jgi:hypothetical protein